MHKAVGVVAISLLGCASKSNEINQTTEGNTPPVIQSVAVEAAQQRGPNDFYLCVRPGGGDPDSHWSREAGRQLV